MSLVLSVTLAVVGGGCQALCVRHSDCPVDYECAASGLCELPPEPPPPEEPAPEPEPEPSVDAAPDTPGGGIPGLPDGSLDDFPDPAEEADAATLPPDDF